MRASTLRRARLQRRSNVELWYPKATELKLPNVPEQFRSEVRKYLAPVLRRFSQAGHEIDIAVKAGECWNTAQCLQVFADDKLKYVEGVWTRSPENAWWSAEDAADPSPHAWNSYQGYIVDLIAEFYNWNSSGEDSPWLHEPVREYSYAELDSYMEIKDGNHWICVSSGLWLSNGGRETLSEEIQRNLTRDGNDSEHQRAFDFVNDIVFKECKERLLAQLSAAKGAAA